MHTVPDGGHLFRMQAKDLHGRAVDVNQHPATEWFGQSYSNPSSMAFSSDGSSWRECLLGMVGYSDGHRGMGFDALGVISD